MKLDVAIGRILACSRRGYAPGHRALVALDLSGAVEGAKAELEESEAWARLKASSKSVEWRRSASGLRLEVLLKLHDYDGAVVRAHAVRLRRLCCWLGRRRVIARWRRR